jgi:hypothetical protein
MELYLLCPLFGVQIMVGREGFEPPKSETSGLQPDPFDHFGTDPCIGF